MQYSTCIQEVYLYIIWCVVILMVLGILQCLYEKRVPISFLFYYSFLRQTLQLTFFSHPCTTYLFVIEHSDLHSIKYWKSSKNNKNKSDFEKNKHYIIEKYTPSRSEKCRRLKLLSIVRPGRIAANQQPELSWCIIAARASPPLPPGVIPALIVLPVKASPAQYCA